MRHLVPGFIEEFERGNENGVRDAESEKICDLKFLGVGKPNVLGLENGRRKTADIMGNRKFGNCMALEDHIFEVSCPWNSFGGQREQIVVNVLDLGEAFGVRDIVITPDAVVSPC